MESVAHPFSPTQARAHARDVVKRSGSSFSAGMNILEPARRDAMFGVYAFCREVDDIADCDGPQEEKVTGLRGWRTEVERIYRGAPKTATGVSLLAPIESYGLPKQEFIMVIEGMEMDAQGPIIAPSMDGLLAYTRRAAGAVGMLSMPVFGAPSSEMSDQFALALGDALQLTNILRDVEEDAQIGRLYLPYELLKKHGCPLDPRDISDAPGLPAVRAELAQIAREKYQLARAALAELDWRVLRPALLMMGIYEAYLDRMEKRGWANGQRPISISKIEKMAIATRWFHAPKLKRQ